MFKLDHANLGGLQGQCRGLPVQTWNAFRSEYNARTCRVCGRRYAQRPSSVRITTKWWFGKHFRRKNINALLESENGQNHRLASTTHLSGRIWLPGLALQVQQIMNDVQWENVAPGDQPHSGKPDNVPNSRLRELLAQRNRWDFARTAAFVLSPSIVYDISSTTVRNRVKYPNPVRAYNPAERESNDHFAKAFGPGGRTVKYRQPCPPTRTSNATAPTCSASSTLAAPTTSRASAAPSPCASTPTAGTTARSWPWSTSWTPAAAPASPEPGYGPTAP